MAAVWGREKVVKSGKLVLDGGVLAGVDALGGSVAVEVDDHEDV